MASVAPVSMYGLLPEVSGRPISDHPYNNEKFIVGGAYACFLKISSFFGVAPLRFKPHSDGYVVSISIPMCIYSYILMTVYVLVSIYSVMSDYATSTVSRAALYAGLAACCFETGVGIYEAPCRMRKLFKSMSTIALVDQSIAAKYSQTKERRVSICPAILFFFSFLVALADFFFTLLHSNTIFFQHSFSFLLVRIIFCVGYWLNCLLKMQFAFTAMSVRARFSAVNKVLSLTAKHLAVPYIDKEESPYVLNIFARRLAPAELHCKTVILRKSVTGQLHLAVPLSDAVQRVSILRDLLCDVLDDLTNNYGVYLVFALMSTVLNITANVFFSTTMIWSHTATFSKDEYVVTEKHNYFMFLQCLWFILNLMGLLMLLEPGHYTIKEIKETEDIVSRMIVESPSHGALASRLKVFSRQLMLRRVGYRPMGLFTLSRSLTASIFGIVLTHVVIMLQF